MEVLYKNKYRNDLPPLVRAADKCCSNCSEGENSLRGVKCHLIGTLMGREDVCVAHTYRKSLTAV